MRLRSITLILILLACVSLHMSSLPRAHAVANQTAFVMNAGNSQLGPPSVSTTTYARWPYTSNGPWRTTETDKGQIIGIDGGGVTFTNWSVFIETAPGSGKSWLFTVRKNGSDTGMAVTIANSATSATYTGTLTAAAGDLLSVRCDPSGTPAACGSYSWYSQTTSSGQLITGNGGDALSLAANTYYCSLIYDGRDTSLATEDRPVPTGGTFDNFYLYTSDPGAGGNYTATITTAADPGDASPTMADTSITCQITNGNTQAHDTTHSLHVDAGAFVETKFVVGAGAANCTRITWSCRFVPDVAGEMVVQGEQTSIPTSASVYGWLFLKNNSLNTTESSAQVPHPTVVLKKFWTYSYTGNTTFNNLTAGQSLTHTIRKNGVDSTVTVTVTGASQRKATDLAHTLSLTAGDLISLHTTSNATAGTNTATRYALVYLVTQPTGRVVGSLSLLGAGG